jgi:hypothetical protein
MSRVGYKNEHIQKAFQALDGLEQTMGWNLRCAYPDASAPATGAVVALAQIMQAAAEVHRLVSLAEKESLELFREQAEQQEQFA